jgi:hypothetical protein
VTDCGNISATFLNVEPLAAGSVKALATSSPLALEAMQAFDYQATRSDPA